MRTGNPALNDQTFTGFQYARGVAQSMSIQGTVNKTGLLLLLALCSASWTWNLYYESGNPAAVTPWVFGGAVGGLIVAFVTMWKKPWAAVTAPAYALLEGLVLGGLSSILEAQYPGIAFQAVGLTFGTLVSLLLAYRSGLIRATENFKLGVVAATGGIFVVYLVTLGLGMFGVQIPGVYGNGMVGIGFSLFVVGLAALNLVLDFDFIETGAANRAPKYMEWYAAFGLIVTLVWLYIEILRLLAKLRSRD